MFTYDDTAAKLFGSTSPNPVPGAASTDAIAEKLFGSSTHAQTNLNDKPDLSESAETLASANDRWRGSLSTVQLSAPEGLEITDLVRQFSDKPPDAATRKKWVAEASEALERRYGPVEARARLQAAKVLAKRDARFLTALKETGCSDHPRVIAILADRAHSLRLAGKL